MRLTLTLLCIALSLCAFKAQMTATKAPTSNEASLFTLFVRTQGKKYSSVDEFNYRSRVFVQNLVFVLGGKTSKLAERVSVEDVDGANVIKVKRGGNACDFEMSMNKFSDLSDEEFRSYYLLPQQFFDEQAYKPVSKLLTQQNGETVFAELDHSDDLIGEVLKLDVNSQAKDTKTTSKSNDTDDKQKVVEELRTCLNSMKAHRDVRVTKPVDQGVTKSCRQVLNIKTMLKRMNDFKPSYTKTDDSNNDASNTYNFSHQFAERKLQSTLTYAPKYLAQEFDSMAAIGSTRVPMSLDWNQISPLTPVKDQKKCNSCYVFSATSSLEAHNSIINNSMDTLSEQEILDCSTENEACVGGQPYLVYDYAIKNGLSYDRNYVYTAKAGTCRANNMRSSNKFTGLRGYVFPKPGVLNLIKALQYGPVVALMYASNDLKYYYDGVYEGQGCAGEETPNHSALVYGYDLTADKPYFLLKNNWGTGWGDSGFYKVAIGPLNSSNMGYCLLAQTKYNVLPVLKR